MMRKFEMSFFFFLLSFRFVCSRTHTHTRIISKRELCVCCVHHHVTSANIITIISIQILRRVLFWQDS